MVAVLACGSSARAGWTDYLDRLKGAAGDAGVTAPGAALSNADMVAGLKEALEQGTQFAVKQLGRDGGFLDNSQVRIPVPDSLSWVEKSLRTLGQEELADEFIASMNHAAEQAVPEASAVFGAAIREMTVQDAQGILNGPDDAATEYFRAHTQAELTEKMRPIVAEATAHAGVTSAYKSMTARAGGLTSLVSGDAVDLDGYVTEKTLDGLFLMVATEEKKIREDPAARSTELLKKVFGSP
jgi:hypothetical protein